MSKYRLPLALILLIPLAGAAYWASRQQAREEKSVHDLKALLPPVEAASIHRIAIDSPRTGAIAFERRDEAFRIVEPLDTRPDEQAMQALIDALSGLKATGVAATREVNHARLWVDDKNGIRVKAKDAGGKTLLDLIVGRYLPESEVTLLRPAGQVLTLNVEGWLREKVEREVEDWRARIFFGLDPEDVQKLSFSCPDAQLRFERDGEGWKVAEGQKPIANLEKRELDNRSASLSRFRGSGFAPPEVDADKAGTGPDSPRTASFVTNEDPPRTFTLRFGGPAGTVKREDGTDKQMFYVQHDDDPVVYTTSEYLRNYLCPTPDQLVKKEETP